MSFLDRVPFGRREGASKRKARPGASKGRRSYRPTLEPLEDRRVPATLITEAANVNQTVGGGSPSSNLTNIIRLSGTNLGGYDYLNDVTSTTPTKGDLVNLVTFDVLTRYIQVGGNTFAPPDFGGKDPVLVTAVQGK